MDMDAELMARKFGPGEAYEKVVVIPLGFVPPLSEREQEQFLHVLHWDLEHKWVSRRHSAHLCDICQKKREEMDTEEWDKRVSMCSFCKSAIAEIRWQRKRAEEEIKKRAAHEQRMLKEANDRYLEGVSEIMMERAENADLGSMQKIAKFAVDADILYRRKKITSLWIGSRPRVVASLSNPHQYAVIDEAITNPDGSHKIIQDGFLNERDAQMERFRRKRAHHEFARFARRQ